MLTTGDPHCDAKPHVRAGWCSDKLPKEQADNLDIGPITKRKAKGDDCPTLEEILPESRGTKVLWRQWERLFVVFGGLHRKFHELEGHG